MARSVPAGAGDSQWERQRETPLADALDRQRINRLAHFDVPAHKSGRGNLELTEYLGSRAMAMDVNSMKPLDNLGHPVSVIKDAQALAAEAFGADDAFFMVNGTTSAVQAMIMSTCRATSTAARSTRLSSAARFPRTSIPGRTSGSVFRSE